MVIVAIAERPGNKRADGYRNRWFLDPIYKGSFPQDMLDWYAAQGSTDPLPSPGLPDIVALIKPSSLIGRVSHSRGIFPDVDCELDTGCSRRHAMLTTDGTRWWVEDLGSANGTFVGQLGTALPDQPIAARTEVDMDARIYVGSWTRIVIRPAAPDEADL